MPKRPSSVRIEAMEVVEEVDGNPTPAPKSKVSMVAVVVLIALAIAIGWRLVKGRRG
jgi:hypothetical protein